MARSPSAVQSVCSWRAGEPNAFWPLQICSHLTAELGTPATPSHGLEPQQLSPDTKGDFQAAWWCRHPQSLPGCAISFALVPGFSECPVQEGERELCWNSHSLPPWPVWNGFPIAAMETVPRVTEEGICVAFSCCQVWGGESPHFTQSKFPLGEEMSDLIWGAGGRTVWL